MSAEEIYRRHVWGIANAVLDHDYGETKDLPYDRALWINVLVDDYVHGRDDDSDKGLQLMIGFVLCHADTQRFMDTHLYAFGVAGRDYLAKMATLLMSYDVQEEVDRLDATHREDAPLLAVSGQRPVRAAHG